MLLAIVLAGGYFRLAKLNDSALQMDNYSVFWMPCATQATAYQMLANWQRIAGMCGQLPFPVAVTQLFLHAFHLPLTFGNLILPSALWGVATIVIAFFAGREARGAKMAVVDIDPAELAKYPARFNHSICADARDFLTALLRDAAAAPVARPQAWLAQCESYRARFPWVGDEHRDAGGFINSYAFMERLNAHFKPDQFVVTDMGTALLSGHQVLRFKQGQRLMTSQGLGEMGYGLPGAIGASFARERGEVLCLNCDGGMMMNLQELQTVAHHQLPIKIIIFNNDGYLMIKHTQKAIMSGRFAGTDRKSGVSCPDFSKLAVAFNLPAWQIRTWEDVARVLPQLQACPGPAICEVFMHPTQLFVPKLSLAVQQDGSLVSPPLEDLSPLLPREVMRESMLVGLHPKSEKIGHD